MFSFAASMFSVTREQALILKSNVSLTSSSRSMLSVCSDVLIAQLGAFPTSLGRWTQWAERWLPKHHWMAILCAIIAALNLPVSIHVRNCTKSAADFSLPATNGDSAFNPRWSSLWKLFNDSRVFKVTSRTPSIMASMMSANKAVPRPEQV